MVTPTTRRSFRFAMFALLYFVQGSALAYFRNFQKPYLDQSGVDADLIGLLTAILLVPFILKIFIGMLSDRVNLLGLGHRKPYIVAGLVLAGLGFGLASLFDPANSIVPFMGLMIVGSFSVALFDSTTDGLAIDTTPPREQAAVQGFMVGGRALGFIVLSLIFGVLVQAEGYAPMFVIIGLGMLLPLLLVLQIHESPEREPDQRFEWSAFGGLGKPQFLIFGAYAVLYSVTSFGLDGLPTFYLSEAFGSTGAVLGNYGALRGVGAVVGAVGAGFLMSRVGRPATAFGALIGVSIGALLFGLTSSVQQVLGVGLVWGVAWGFQETVFVALAMSVADSRIAASMFAIMMAVSNLGSAIGEGVFTGLTDNLSFSMVFMIIAGINLIVLPVLWGFFRVSAQQAVPDAGALAPAEGK
ncbi:MAG: MFS transporter [Chloroflexi bacterium]|nr:MFS transporter [Chloroflexota bacterium]